MVVIDRVLVCTIVLFPYTRNFAPQFLSTQIYIKRGQPTIKTTKKTAETIHIPQ